MRHASTLLALLCLGALARAADPVVAEKDLVPDGEFTLECPSLGESRLSAEQHPKKPQMVAMQVKLPSNYERKRALPVLCVYRGWNGSGNAFSEWNKAMGGVNFIALTVDYNASGGDQGFTNMAYALKVLERATPIDRASLVVAGDGGGANMIAAQLGADRLFGAAVLLGGSSEIDPKPIGGRPVLVVANQDDSGGKNENQPLTNFERQLALYESIKKAGGTAELIIADKWWNWPPTYGPRIRDWVNQAVPNPELKRAWLIDRELGLTRNEERLRWCYQQMADTWVETPRSAEARKKLNAGAR